MCFSFMISMAARCSEVCGWGHDSLPAEVREGGREGEREGESERGIERGMEGGRDGEGGRERGWE